jgi:hypothetical protein
MAADSENTLRESIGIVCTCTSQSLIAELLRTPSPRSSRSGHSRKFAEPRPNTSGRTSQRSGAFGYYHDFPLGSSFNPY